MRAFAIGLACALACALGGVQIAAGVALRDRAQPPAWMRYVPAAVGARVDRLDPHVPLPPALRLVLARHALARDDLDYAARAAAGLEPSRDRLALEAEIAERRGDRAAAVRAYLAAGDLAGVEAAVARLEAAGHFAGARALQEDVVARLSGDRTQSDALAQAYYGLGRIEETSAYALRPRSSERRAAESRALDAYDRASRLAPLSVRYLIAVGNQRLNLGDITAARRTFERARDADPTSAEPLTGLGDVALRTGARAQARALLARARALDPQSEAVRRLATELHS